MATAHVDGMDVLAVHEAARARWRRCAEQRRRCSWSCAPTASARIRCSTPSSTATSAEVERWKQHGPIHTFTGRLKEAGMMTEADSRAMDRARCAEVDEAVAFAEAGTWEPVEDLRATSPAHVGPR
jgi:pyruvate dehydrogenase E1 component alpha subunit